MKKIILFMLILLSFTGCSYHNKENNNSQKQINTFGEEKNEKDTIVQTETPITTPTVTPKIIKNNNIDENELLNNLKEICKSPRKFDTDGEDSALDYLINKMTEYGYRTQTQEFYVYNKTIKDIYSATLWEYFNKYTDVKDSVGKGMNLIATTAHPDNKKTLYITAHYDTTTDTNGIRDNGSGIVVAMEIARQLQGINLPINIEFIFFSAEEAGMQGSSYFISRLTKEEKDEALGCINIDVVGEKGNNKVALKTYSYQMNALSLLMDEYHKFQHSRSEASDHTSFYMGGIPAIYFADENAKIKDDTNNPLEELDIEKLKELTRIIYNFIITFNIDDYYNLIKSSYTQKYTNLPKEETINNYSLIQVNKILREDGAGSFNQYIWKSKKGNLVEITEKDNRFLVENLEKEIQTFHSYNQYTKYKVYEKNNRIIVKYVVALKFYELKGTISKDEALKLLNKQENVTYELHL
ncbi:M20/M25/M40 family metallo-hydrolase [Anaeromicropila herbilytica]|uniref:Peptidase M28 domain-containing protein n=1 Tax=Anaeromicropila herbilytica TaxID=2785025 RepID=A0A7R7EL97_9FIRM|nr:M20/M25/M40 family metallo-hydrolase [Anaeromicropila herbilytica]BCN31105.1 hypothetical protein bsdtb5_24000 [Anaeromicropila herbilytica]